MGYWKEKKLTCIYIDNFQPFLSLPYAWKIAKHPLNYFFLKLSQEISKW